MTPFDPSEPPLNRIIKQKLMSVSSVVGCGLMSILSLEVLNYNPITMVPKALIKYHRVTNFVCK